MPRTTKNSAHGKNNFSQEESEFPSNPEDIASSDKEIYQEPDPEVLFHPFRAQQAIANMFMPYIEVPGWTEQPMMLSTTDI